MKTENKEFYDNRLWSGSTPRSFAGASRDGAYDARIEKLACWWHMIMTLDCFLLGAHSIVTTDEA